MNEVRQTFSKKLSFSEKVLLLFFFLVPFEYYYFDWATIYIFDYDFSMVSLVGYCALFFNILSFPPAIRFQRKYFWLLLLVTTLITIITILSVNKNINSGVWQNLILFALASYFTGARIKNDTVVNTVILGITAAMLLRVYFYFIGYQVVENQERITNIGSMDSGTSGVISAYLIVFMIIMYQGRLKTPLFSRKMFLVVISCANILNILLCNSRGSLVIMMVLMLFFSYDSTINFKKGGRLFSWLFIFALLILVVDLSGVVDMGNLVEKMDKRWEEGDIEHKTTGRYSIFKASLEAIYENPLGYGFGEGRWVVGYYREGYRNHPDYHNDFLRIGVEGGVLCLFLFFWFYYSMLKKAWEFYRKKGDILPISLIMMVLTASMFLTSTRSKLSWLILGIATGYLSREDPNNGNAVQRNNTNKKLI